MTQEVMSIKFDNSINISNMKRVRGSLEMKKLDNMVCKQCQLGKMKNYGFKSKTHTSKEIKEIFHTNLCGLIDVKNYKGDKYIILFMMIILG